MKYEYTKGGNVGTFETDDNGTIRSCDEKVWNGFPIEAFRSWLEFHDGAIRSTVHVRGTLDSTD